MTILLTEDQLAALRAIDSPTISNAIEHFRVRDPVEGYLGMDIHCLFPDLGTMAGYAVTATVDSTTRGDVRPRRAMPLWEAVHAAPRPAVLVFQDVGPQRRRSAHFGEVMATIARRLGAIGLITDGGVRDVNEVHALAFHLFAAGVVVSHGYPLILDVQVPVEIDGVRIEPGALLHGDANGVVLIPDEVAARLPEQVQRVRERERRIMDNVNSPDFSLPGLRHLLGEG
jgi:4-hydroxy-4-methyl-2-oxoglutarate aldolase